MDYQSKIAPSSLRLRAARAKALCFAALFMLVAAPAAWSASIPYGDMDDVSGGGTVFYIDILESSGTDPVPLYDTPDVTLNNLDFDPTSFVATSSGGVDVTDGQLSFGMKALAGHSLETIDFNESGRYTLQGGGSASALYGIGYTLTVLEIDGVAVTPFDILDGASGAKTLPGDLGFLAPWTLQHSLDLDAALTTAGKTFTFGVTKAEITVDDQLLATTDPGNFSFIDKKDFDITVNTDPMIPEPTTLVLAGLGVISLMVRRKSA